MSEGVDSQAQMLVNRVRKNRRRLRAWLRKDAVTAYRLYDRDIPELPVAVDWYDGRLLIALYGRPGHDDGPDRQRWLQTVGEAVAQALEVPAERLFFRRRERQRGLEQYERQTATDPSNSAPDDANANARFVVTEAGRRLLVDLGTYLDTGLFLDHRPLRRIVGEKAAGKRVLNLFGYTASFTVYAATAGAKATTTVDMSNTYLQWAADNLRENGCDAPHHKLERADVMAWLAEPRGQHDFYDLAIIDPPTFSNSKRMAGAFDVQRDHVPLVRATARVMQRGATMWFSTNLRTFKLDSAALADLSPRDITADTIPPDFRNRRIHQAFELLIP